MLPKIFSGVKVLDFSRLLPGPFASELLIKMGAEVTCVTPPVGDPLLGDYSPFEVLRKGKKFQTIDLKTGAGLKQAKELLSQSSILMEGFRPGAMERLGLGFKEAKKTRKDLLYVSINGYGEGHPKFLDGAHDLNFLIDSGFYSLLFPDDCTDIPVIQLADLIGGFYAAFKMLAYWIESLKSAKAQHVRVSIVEGLELMATYLKDPATSFWLPMITGGASRYHIYRSKDGHRIMVAAIEQKFYDNMLKALNIELAPNDGEPGLIKKVQKAFSGKTLSELQKAFNGVDACISFIPSREEVLRPNQKTH